MNTKLTLEQAVKNIKPVSEESRKKAYDRQESLLKPLGSLGVLEDISIQMAGITGEVFNNIDKKIVFLFGADNGVYEEGVAAAEQEFTNMLISGYAVDNNSGINVICKFNNVDLKLIDIGVKGKLDYSNIYNHRLMEGTNNFAKGLSMTRETALKAVEIGISYAVYAKEQGYDIVGTGEVGIGNTTTAAACIISALEISDTGSAVGRGAGLTDESFENKINVIDSAIKMHKPDPKDALDILSKVGGLDIAALVGVYIGCAALQLPVVIDGVISIAAALLATTLNPVVESYMFPSHLSEEPAYKVAAAALHLSPYLNLKMRLGEGAGCPIAMSIIENALAVMNNMGSFADVSPETDYRDGLTQ